MVSTCGTGGGNFPLPGDPDNNVTLSAVSAFGGIDVSWTFPQSNSHAVAHTILYRGTSSSFALAAQHKIVSGNSFFDAVPQEELYFYWIQIVSVNGTVGDLIGPASATAQGLVADLLTTLTARIDSGLLAQSLRSEIDQISTLNANLAAEIFDRETGETSFAQSLLDIETGLAEAHTFIASNEESRVTDNSAIAESLDFLAVTLGDDVASVVTTTSAWINDVTGDIGAMYTARLTVNGLIGGFGIINDGDFVEAGFDVDTFWVGRTNADSGSKPFIIDNGQVFIDEAFIRNVTADFINVNADIVTLGKGVFNGTTISATGLHGAILANENGTNQYGIVGFGKNIGGSVGAGLLGESIGVNADGVAGRANQSGRVGVIGSNPHPSGFGVYSDGPFGTSSTNLVANLNTERMGNTPWFGWARIFPTNSGTANAAGAGINIMITGALAASVRTRGTGNFVWIENISDRRRKKNIENETLGLSFINALIPRSYIMREGNGNKCHGLIAQEVQELIPNNDNLVCDNGDGTLGFDYNGIVSPLIKAIQELSAKVDSLQKEINILKNQNT